MKKKLTAVCVLTAAVCLFAATAFAETGDVAGVIQSTWQSAAQQIKTVVNTVVFPALDLILVLKIYPPYMLMDILSSSCIPSRL